MESLLFPLLLAMLAVFMFMTMRKQKKRMSEMQEMQSAVATGTRVQLTSGLFGTVIDATSSDTVDVEIATGVVTRWNRLAIMRVVPTDEAAATYAGYIEPEADPDDFDADDFEAEGIDLEKNVDDADAAPDTADQKRDGDK
ncbi:MULTISPECIES: preprotein translocase subunit YajC [unclassified Gordonia (in: high G+C Gram-positive bacteria)]|uniref:preprotein translocase subunit YajC n=1 Tax=unclassified Gordonia (in: high G+C Gram-positive bacteria) TaxID=2657482 RepID=UPI001F10B601|nr:preprotein translocase subunit YajC [Gordonia sp. ABSL49_1]MCH5643560.1 preprotein translocase subunit YajC [Gordonia sp. ABSL49_1]